MAEDFNQTATHILRAELARAGVNYKTLAERLAASGECCTAKAVASKIQRGTFSFAFFLHCMRAVGRDVVRLND